MAKPQGFGKQQKAKQQAKRQQKVRTLTVLNREVGYHGLDIGLHPNVLNLFSHVWILGEGDQ